MPLIVSWGIWIARNECIFNDLSRTVLEIVTRAVGLIVLFTDVDALLRHRLCPTIQIDDNMPWAFFNGATGGLFATGVGFCYTLILKITSTLVLGLGLA